jgi:hypothetical protein
LEKAKKRGEFSCVDPGAQAMLDLRATYLNGEWEAFWNFHVTQEDQRLYGKMREAG